MDEKRKRDIIVIGTSAGGVEALSAIVRGLPENLPASIFVVMHVPPSAQSVLNEILSRRGPLPALQPRDKEHIKNGRIYVAPPDYHMIIEGDHICLSHGPKENRSRPAIDPLFRSAALTYGPRVVGVVLTGALDDGTAGLLAIKRYGGATVVQDPHEALFTSMPRSAIEAVKPHYICSLAEISGLLVRLAEGKVAFSSEGSMGAAESTKERDDSGGSVMDDVFKLENKFAKAEKLPPNAIDKIGKPARYACPECGGTLWEINDDEVIRFRCRVGHAFTAKSLLAEHGVALEAALWAAMRALEEREEMVRQLAQQIEAGGASKSNSGGLSLAGHLHEQVQETRKHIELLRGVLSEVDFDMAAEDVPS